MGFWQGWKGWRRYRKLDSEWRHIVFYSESGQDWHHFKPLVDELTGVLERQVTYVSSDVADPGLDFQHPRFAAVCIPEGFFLTLHFQLQKARIVVLTMMDLDQFHLKRSVNPVHYVYIFHGMGSTHMVDHASSYDAYDSLFCVGPHHLHEIRRREELYELDRKNLFEYGYPRLETLMAESVHSSFPDSGKDRQVVLIAPTWGDDAIFNRCGTELIRILLDAGFQVIMRPHYHTRRRTPELISSLLDEFSGHPHFEYVDRMGENESLFRSDLLISDWSAMAIEYALGLEKPVLFIDLPRRVRNPDWQALGIEPLEASIRSEVGHVLAADQLDQAPARIASLLHRPGEFRQRLKALRETSVFNPSDSVSLGAREIARLADAQPPEDSPETGAHG